MSSALSLVGRGLFYSRVALQSAMPAIAKAAPSSISPRILQDLSQTFDRSTTKSFQVGDHKDFVILELFDARDGSEMGQYSGFHGSTAKRLEDQVAKGFFENRNLPIYYAGFNTALKYAGMANGWIPCEMGSLSRPTWDASFPMIVRVASEQKPDRNDLVKNPDLHDHFYFPAGPDQKVRIVQAWAIHPLMHPSKLAREMRNHHDQIGINVARAALCFALRRVGLIKY